MEPRVHRHSADSADRRRRRGRYARDVRLTVLALVFFCALGCEDEPDGPPPWPALEGSTPSHGLESLEFRAQQPDAEEEGAFSIELRRDGCFRTETIEVDGAETTRTVCTACSDDPAIEQLFVDAKSREVVTVWVKMGKALAPPIRLGEGGYVGYLFLNRANGESRRGSSGDPTLERIARQLYEGVPGAPELGEDRCAEVEETE